MYGNSTVVKSRKGKEYTVVLMDYLTNWLEMFAVKNQDTFTMFYVLVLPSLLLISSFEIFINLALYLYLIYKLAKSTSLKTRQV